MDPEPREADIYLPLAVRRQERALRKHFWQRFATVAGRIPFAEDIAAAYFCAIDPTTPGRVRGILIAALAYFILPFDLPVTLFLALGLMGDAAVLAGTIRMLSRHIKERHYRRARELLGIPEPVED
ncbi:MAG: DUF1232 domain-containing protein [Alphaproteobacteria bacterium]|nr:DUF1232 domain-containing protein [Alphaproteobacteria bacterium]